MWNENKYMKEVSGIKINPEEKRKYLNMEQDERSNT